MNEQFRAVFTVSHYTFWLIILDVTVCKQSLAEKFILNYVDYNENRLEKRVGVLYR